MGGENQENLSNEENFVLPRHRNAVKPTELYIIEQIQRYFVKVEKKSQTTKTMMTSTKL